MLAAQNMPCIAPIVATGWGGEHSWSFRLPNRHIAKSHDLHSSFIAH